MTDKEIIELEDKMHELQMEDHCDRCSRNGDQYCDTCIRYPESEIGDYFNEIDD